MKDKKNTQPLSIYHRSDAASEQAQPASESLPAEQELKSLLNRWSVPERPSASLDSRLLGAFRQEFKRVPFWQRLFGARDAVQKYSVPSREEVFMKQCS